MSVGRRLSAVATTVSELRSLVRIVLRATGRRRSKAGQLPDFLEDVSVRRAVQTLRGLMGRVSGRREENFRAAFVELWPAARRVARRVVADHPAAAHCRRG